MIGGPSLVPGIAPVGTKVQVWSGDEARDLRSGQVCAKERYPRGDRRTGGVRDLTGSPRPCRNGPFRGFRIYRAARLRRFRRLLAPAALRLFGAGRRRRGLDRSRDALLADDLAGGWRDGDHRLHDRVRRCPRRVCGRGPVSSNSGLCAGFDGARSAGCDPCAPSRLGPGGRLLDRSDLPALASTTPRPPARKDLAGGWSARQSNESSRNGRGG